MTIRLRNIVLVKRSGWREIGQVQTLQKGKLMLQWFGYKGYYGECRIFKPSDRYSGSYEVHEYRPCFTRQDVDKFEKEFLEKYKLIA